MVKKAPFWADQAAAFADEVTGGALSSAAGVVNPVVAPFWNAVAPEGYKLDPSYSGIKKKQQNAFQSMPDDFQNLARMPHPGSMAGMAPEAATAIFAGLPAIKHLKTTKQHHPNN